MGSQAERGLIPNSVSKLVVFTLSRNKKDREHGSVFRPATCARVGEAVVLIAGSCSGTRRTDSNFPTEQPDMVTRVQQFQQMVNQAILAHGFWLKVALFPRVHLFVVSPLFCIHVSRPWDAEDGSFSMHQRDGCRLLWSLATFKSVCPAKPATIQHWPPWKEWKVRGRVSNVQKRQFMEFLSTFRSKNEHHSFQEQLLIWRSWMPNATPWKRSDCAQETARTG